MDAEKFQQMLRDSIGHKENPFHPFVWITGNPVIGPNTFIGAYSSINAKEVEVEIGHSCDFSSYVMINAADSHRRCIELDDQISRKPIKIGDHVFIGTHSAVLGGVIVGHHSVIAAGTIVREGEIPPFSLVLPHEVKRGYYRDAYVRKHGNAPE
jgi:acetyltransferase-like isoleucine patch superfamily enzyme